MVAIGMILFARMGEPTQRIDVVVAMIIAGFGMGLLQPVYTVAVQNVAPRKYMGAATASTAFFRSIGSTMGVAIFGSVLLTGYHHDLMAGIPSDTPPAALKLFSNPLLLRQMGPQAQRGVRPVRRTGSASYKCCWRMCGLGLLHGLQHIFFASAVMMSLAVLLHVALQRRAVAPPSRARTGNSGGLA